MRRPRTPADLGLDHRDRRRLRAALARASDARQFRRLQAVWLLATGHSAAEAAAVTASDVTSVYRALARYLRARRADALADAPRSGRPRRATSVTDAQLQALLRTSPMTLGYCATGWTIALLAAHLARTYGATCSASTLRRRVHALDYRWKRPRYVYAEKDPHRAQKKGGSFAA